MKSFIGSLIGLVFVVAAAAEPLLEGRVRLESGEPVADVQVRIFDLSDLRQGAIARALTDGTGYFALPLATLGGRALPAQFALGPNYPNPFNPSTIIPYQLAASSAVRLEVFNLLGQHLVTLVDGERPAGFHTATWTATDGAGRAVGSGVYIYRMTVGEDSQTGRMVLIDGQAGMPSAGRSRPTAVAAVGEASPVYGLTVSGPGLVLIDPAFQREADRGTVELVVEAPGSTPWAKGATTGILGDVDNSGQVDFFDALMVALYSQDNSIVLPNHGAIWLGDVNADGQVDRADAGLIGTYLNDPSDPALPAGLGKRVSSATASLSLDPSEDLDVLLDGVAEIAAPGVPGPLCVYGPEAFPVIVGATSVARAPVVAAARWSAGRVVALGHDGYFDRSTLKTADTGHLMTNALRWAAGEGAPADPRIGVVGRAELRAWLTKAGHDAVEAALTPTSLKGVDVVALVMWNQSASELEALSAFVRGGGGLVTACTGWGWASLHPDLDLVNDYAGNRLLAPVGIQWSNDYLDRTSPRGYAVDGPPHELTHAGTAVEAYATGRRLTSSQINQAFDTLVRTVRVLPVDDTLLTPRLDALVESTDHRYPSANQPVDQADVIPRLAAALFVVEHGRTPPRAGRAHPAAADFPGSVPSDAPRLTRTLTIDTAEPRGTPTGASYAPRWHSTGLYAAPGELVTVTVPAATARKGGFHVRVGAHSDAIWDRPEWMRMPEISRLFPVSAATTLVANAFGGLIYVEVPEDAGLGKITVKIEGAVAAPLFVLGETDLATWRNEIRYAPAPWAEIAGRNMIVTTDAREVRGLDDPAAVAETWDRVLDLSAELAAWPSPARLRPERFVVDRQISVGYMHDGYPLMAHLDQQANLVNAEHLRSEGNWGFFHEVGHNHQSPDWTFDGTVEVSVNLFTLYVYEFLCGIPVAKAYHEWAGDHTRAKIERYDFNNPDFELWKREPGLALFMYVQLQEAFGWEAYRQVFATYRALPDAERPKSDNEKRDQWLVRFSRQVGRNLGPFFEAWGVPTSRATRASIADLPVWFPPNFP